jgi:DNA-directed RNA polymerase specialized sigma24 family protein
VPRDVVALVSADDFVSAIRVYADRVNDLLRRRGVPAAEAVETAETHALALLDTVVNAPETVIDLAGWWFARAVELARSARRRRGAAADEAVSMLAGTETEAQVRTALGRLGDDERSAVILRDAYDLPPQAVGVALRRGADTAAALTAQGRLALVAAYDGRPVPDLAAHSGRTTVDMVSLSRLADDSLDSPRAAPLRRHIASCPACEEVLEALARGRRLAAGLPIIAMDDEAREAMIERVAEQAAAVLPSHELVLRAVDEDHDPGPVLRPIVAIAALVVALVLGAAVGAVSRPGPSYGVLGGSPPPSVSPVTPSFSVSPSPHHRPSRSASPSPGLTPSSLGTLPTTSTSPIVSGPARIEISPGSGPSGTDIEVSGTGWAPGTEVVVSYAGQQQTTAQADDRGNFSAQVVANSVLPGNRKVTASNGQQSASATFMQRL